MKIEKQENETAVILLPVGDLVYEGIEELETLLKGLTDESRYIIIDLTFTKYLSAKAISIIVEYVKIFRARRKDLKFVNVNKNVIKLFDIIGIFKIISIFENENEVITSICPRVGKLEKKPFVV
ncbi:MAG: hypothetical protein AYP45_05240 [Candidatus Brocadia carolinensis]|uniref:STAS domain-containing protein n=1 Tax=Candidatus Brocadia carolinensis TaxID=1004156 RepID=A0A1V4AVF3_9BACT|nr:MAG: hypothetical protein AYP45_05240 [Candidatus Brocadia caroliniensis]